MSSGAASDEATPEKRLELFGKGERREGIIDEFSLRRHPRKAKAESLGLAQSRARGLKPHRE